MSMSTGTGTINDPVTGEEAVQALWLTILYHRKTYLSRIFATSHMRAMQVPPSHGDSCHLHYLDVKGEQNKLKPKARNGCCADQGEGFLHFLLRSLSFNECLWRNTKIYARICH